MHPAFAPAIATPLHPQTHPILISYLHPVQQTGTALIYPSAECPTALETGASQWTERWAHSVRVGVERVRVQEADHLREQTRLANNKQQSAHAGAVIHESGAGRMERSDASNLLRCQQLCGHPSADQPSCRVTS